MYTCKTAVASMVLVLWTLPLYTAELTPKSFYGGRLRVSVPAGWLHRGFDLGEVQTEQFNDRKRSVIMSFCLEEPAGRNFSQYCDYRFDAARVPVWEAARGNFDLPIAGEYRYRYYDYVREGKNHRAFKKFVICVRGKNRFLTVTLQVNNEVLEREFGVIRAVLSSMEVD